MQEIIVDQNFHFRLNFGFLTEDSIVSRNFWLREKFICRPKFGFLTKIFDFHQKLQFIVTNSDFTIGKCHHEFYFYYFFIFFAAENFDTGNIVFKLIILKTDKKWWKNRITKKNKFQYFNSQILGGKLPVVYWRVWNTVLWQWQFSIFRKSKLDLIVNLINNKKLECWKITKCFSTNVSTLLKTASNQFWKPATIITFYKSCENWR